MGSGKERIAADVFSPSAVCASSQMTSWYASRSIESTCRANHAYVWIVSGAFVGEVARELGDEQAAVGEDQHAERAGRLDEAGGRDRLARRGRMAESVAADRARILLRRQLRLLLGSLVLAADVVVLVFLLDRLDVHLAVAVRVVVLLARGDQLGEHPGERVDLVLAERGARRGARLRLGEDALEAKHQSVAHLPLRGWSFRATVHLGDRVVERAPARCAFGENALGILAVPEERLARPRFCAGSGGD